ncbi:MAG: 2-oxoglutarate dehydrogenase complex dihydrolipoyllysine-residue succinyltransferase [Rhodospirillaceae bacterium]|nr:MAG: 2-oxoglutarate dehydrogenase complex dihydrolipoyllysine-residue succinyltransferase [Rhodospirillaceae bacterium]
MPTEIKVPTLGESVTEATVAKWFKKVGDTVATDDVLLELETDKVTVEVRAEAAGTLSEIVAGDGAEVGVGAVLGVIGGAVAAGSEKKAAAPKAEAPKAAAPAKAEAPKAAAPKAAAPAAAPPAAKPAAPAVSLAADYPLAPSVRHLVDEHGLDPKKIPANGKSGRLTKADVLAFIAGGGESAVKVAAPDRKPAEERVRMTRLRKRIAERLKEAQNTAAMLTTFNEVDMSAVMALRGRYKDAFEKKHGVKMGFMSFFAKACVAALKELPAVNAEIQGDELVYKNFYDIGIAVGTPQGLVVPVVRNCDVKSFAEIEAEISGLGRKARDGKLALEDLAGGTFTITNGGIYGSMLSTPILNTPQSGILGMHNIKQRAVVLDDGSIVARPMMYLALSYDHRIVDGREAVTFLVRVKEHIEDPSRLLIEA